MRSVFAAPFAARFFFSIAIVLAGGATAIRAQSALDGIDPNANGTVFAVVVQPDGKILVGGDFTTLSPNGGAPVTRNRIARLMPNGTLDAFFNPNANGTVRSIAQADGKILVGGDFTTIGGQTRNRIARVDAMVGGADSFDPNADGTVWSMAVQSDGKIVTCGAFTAIGGAPRNRVARLDATTGQADAFDPNANDTVFSIAVQGDGKIVASGQFTSMSGQPRNRIARLGAATGVADSFDPNASGAVARIALQADGKILAGGAFATIGGQSRSNIARLDAVTGLSDSFNPNANASVSFLTAQADGRILVGGAFTAIGGQTRNRIARLDSATGLSDSFDPNSNAAVNSLAVQADGKILVGGTFTALSPSGGSPLTRNRIARLEVDGRLDRTCPTLNIVHGSLGVLVSAVQADGKVLIGGTFTTVLGVTRNNIARLNTDGTLDTAFNPNANNIVYAIAVQPDGKILVGGDFAGSASIGNTANTRNRIARLNPDGTLDFTFNPNADNRVRTIAVQGDGKVLAGGEFGVIGGQARGGIARLDATNGLADSFNATANDFVRSIVVQSDGRILVGGDFTSIGGQPRNRIARLDATTGLADSFNPNASDLVFSIALQPDGAVLAGGAFTTIGGLPRNRIARLAATTGAADASFNPNADSVVYSIAVQADGKILAGGPFTGIGGQARNRIARLNPANGAADAFNPNADVTVRSIALQADGKVLVGGEFNNIGGQGRVVFARLANDTAALQNLVVSPTTITWTVGGSSPQSTRVTFETSTDNVNFSAAGVGTAVGSNWILTGLSLPVGQNLYIRGRGYSRGGYENGSESIRESVRNVFLPPTFTIDDVTHLEGNTGTTSYVFTVTKTGPTTLNSTVDVQTVDGTAVAPGDYAAISPAQTLVFGPLDTTMQVTVPVNRDTVLEPDETFTLHLTNPTNATIGDADGTGTIQNDECLESCTAIDQCHVAGTCDPETGACSNPPAPEETPCVDGDLCTSEEACHGGVCTGTLLSCTDAFACTNDSCDPGTGTCVHKPESSLCTDGNVCTTDSCDAKTGCVFTNSTGLCDDGNQCTDGDTCSDGTCAGMPTPGATCYASETVCITGVCDEVGHCDNYQPISCGFGGPCRIDSCDDVLGCVHTNVTGPCDDGNVCTTGDECVDGACGTPNNGPCDDGSACTNEHCVDGECVSTDACTDNNACTREGCVNGACGCPVFSAYANYDSTDVPKTIDAVGTPTVSSTVTVSGAAPFLFTVTATTFLRHESASDLDITLTSPAGTVVTLTTDNGSDNGDVFNGTLWAYYADDGNGLPFPADTFDDSNLVTDTTYADQAAKPLLAPEESFGAFFGENPNGVWTLTMSDDSDGNGGTLDNWSVFVLSGPPPVQTTSSFTSSTSIAIPDSPAGPLTSTIVVSTAGDVIGSVRLTTSIVHTSARQLDVTLTSPSGIVVTITSDNGSTNDNVFNGTIWTDKADPNGTVPYSSNNGLVTDQIYVNNVVASPLVPEEGLALFIGENPNGPWTLSIQDDTMLETGTLNGWSLDITTIACATNAVDCSDGNVCTADECNSTTGCANPPNTSACSDGNPCTVGDVCSGGACTPGAPPTTPAETTGILAEPDKRTFKWPPQPAATQYDAVRGSVGALPVGPGGGDEVCLPNVQAAMLVDATTPAPGAPFFFLVRGDNGCGGVGPWGNARHNNPAPALPTFTPRSTTTCP